MRKSIIIAGLLLSAGAIWASVATPILPLPPIRAIAAPQLLPKPAPAMPIVGALDLNARLKAEALTLTQA